MTMCNPYAFQALIIKHGLHLYSKTGMKPNRLYTPKNMMATASAITGMKFKPRDYQAAIDALDVWLQGDKDNI